MLERAAHAILPALLAYNHVSRIARRRREPSGQCDKPKGPPLRTTTRRFVACFSSHSLSALAHLQPLPAPTCETRLCVFQSPSSRPRGPATPPRHYCSNTLLLITYNLAAHRVPNGLYLPCFGLRHMHAWTHSPYTPPLPLPMRMLRLVGRILRLP